MSHAPLFPVILSGGSGTRLWPLSRAALPKQFLPLTGEQSLLQNTVARAMALPGNVTAPLVICNQEHRFLVAEQLRHIDISDASILLEPVGRNTAPAITVAALWLTRHTPDALMLVMPADHRIENETAFAKAVATAHHAASQGYLTTFGIRPHAPETGFGYIQRTQALGHCPGSFTVSAFVEKPDLATAERYLASGEFDWNSGIFLFRADVLLTEMQRLRPDILAACQTAVEQAQQDLDFVRLAPQAFSACPADSIDYAIMEHTQLAAVVPADFGWSDIGSWDALWQVSEKDNNGNLVRGDVMLEHTHNSLIRAESRLVATLGVEDLIVVETADAVLVAHKNHAQDVKRIVERLKAEQRNEHLYHDRVYRPWGWFEGIDAGDRFQVKRIMVNPGAKLSLQMHYHRAEHWIVVSGTALVVHDDTETLLTENQSTYIPLGSKHRLVNPGRVPLHLIEVQSGSYLGEDDIVRFEDIYQRQ